MAEVIDSVVEKEEFLNFNDTAGSRNRVRNDLTWEMWSSNVLEKTKTLSKYKSANFYSTEESITSIAILNFAGAFLKSKNHPDEYVQAVLRGEDSFVTVEFVDFNFPREIVCVEI